MVAGRVGAAIAAELGTMRVTEQIDALRTLATHPIDYLVVPRLIAAQHRAAVADGGGHRRRHRLPVIWWACICWASSRPICGKTCCNYTHDVDLVIGVVKAFIFGGIIALISCYKGLTCGVGAEGVGRATTEAVVYSSITILITNFFLTLVMRQIAGDCYDRSPRLEKKFRRAESSRRRQLSD